MTTCTCVVRRACELPRVPCRRVERGQGRDEGVRVRSAAGRAPRARQVHGLDGRRGGGGRGAAPRDACRREPVRQAALSRRVVRLGLGRAGDRASPEPSRR